MNFAIKIFFSRSFDKVSKKPFLVACNKVVLASGGSDLVNRLGVRGENRSFSWLKYELPLFETSITNVEEEEKLSMRPVVIVGAGLSAADAVIACRKAGIKVIHVFRRVAGGLVSLLNSSSSTPNNIIFFFSWDCLKRISPNTTWCTT